MRDIAARELRFGLAQKLVHAAIETVDPALIRPLGDRDRDQAVQRTSAHRGDVAQAARHSPVADLPSWRIARKMHAFDAEIRGEEQVLIPRSLDHRAIVTDERRITLQLTDNGVFVHKAVAATSPEGSSSPKILPRSSSTSPSSIGISASGILRRTRSMVAGARSRVESPVRRAIATRASCELGIFASASTQRVATVA